MEQSLILSSVDQSNLLIQFAHINRGKHQIPNITVSHNLQFQKYIFLGGIPRKV